MYKLENENLWNSEFYHYLMDDKRIFSSLRAKEIRQDLEHLGALPELDNHFDWATLCIGYCLAKGYSQDSKRLNFIPNTKGYEINSFKTCFQNESYLWLAIMSENLFKHLDSPASKDELYIYIQKLWHIGAIELWNQWDKCKNFKDSDLESIQLFLQELADLATKNVALLNSESNLNTTTINQNLGAVEDQLNEAFKTLNIPAHSLKLISLGVRYNVFEVELTKFIELDKKHNAICSALGVNGSNLIIEQKRGKRFGYQLKLLREQLTWKNLDNDNFEKALRQFKNVQNYILPICIGASESGDAIFNDLTTAPHLLIAGTTGSGKSVTTRAILQSLFTLNDNQIEVAILDPKRVDFKQFENEQKLYGNKIIDEPNDMIEFLENTVDEMEDRYNIMSEMGVDNWQALRKTKELPYRVIFIDELADLLHVNKSVEGIITRLAQKARAAGIHLILSTQRPDANTLAGTLRSNVPSRIAMKVQKSTESNIILDESGAENLLGKGDHLIKWVGEHTYFAHSYNI